MAAARWPAGANAKEDGLDGGLLGGQSGTDPCRGLFTPRSGLVAPVPTDTEATAEGHGFCESKHSQACARRVGGATGGFRTPLCRMRGNLFCRLQHGMAADVASRVQVFPSWMSDVLRRLPASEPTRPHLARWNMLELLVPQEPTCRIAGSSERRTGCILSAHSGAPPPC